MVKIKLSALKQTKTHELLLRFLFGGLATVLAGLVAKGFGPGIGGLFLAFPAIFPASATLVEAHKKSASRRWATMAVTAAEWPPALTHPVHYWAASGLPDSP